MPAPEEITTRDALAVLGVTAASTLTRWVAAGKIAPSRKLPGKTGPFLFWRHDIERLADERLARSNGDAA